MHTVNLKPFTEEQLKLHTKGKVPVIGLVPGQITTRYLKEEVAAENGLFVPIPHIQSCVCLSGTEVQGILRQLR